MGFKNYMWPGNRKGKKIRFCKDCEWWDYWRRLYRLFLFRLSVRIVRGFIVIAVAITIAVTILTDSSFLYSIED